MKRPPRRLPPGTVGIGTAWHRHLHFEDDNPFFDIMEKIVAGRRTRPPRAQPRPWAR